MATWNQELARYAQPNKMTGTGSIVKWEGNALPGSFNAYQAWRAKNDPNYSGYNKYGSGLAGQYQKAYAEAKSANEQRYADILGGYQQRQQAAMSALEGLGTAERAALQKQFGEAASRQSASLIGRGLGGTSVASSVAAKMATSQQESMDQLNERLTRERLGYQTGLSGDTLGFQERREDAYPDLNQMLMLAKLKGQTGAQSGYGLGSMPWGYTMNQGGLNMQSFQPGVGA